MSASFENSGTATLSTKPKELSFQTYLTRLDNALTLINQKTMDFQLPLEIKENSEKMGKSIFEEALNNIRKKLSQSKSF